MIKLHKIDYLGDDSADAAIALLESFWWHIRTEHSKDVWKVWAGEDLLLTASNKDAAEAFIYGLAVAHSLLPDDVADELRRRLQP